MRRAGSEPMRTIKLTLAQLREHAGMSQQQVAEKMGVTQSAISKLESADPSRVTIRKLADFAWACGCELHFTTTPAHAVEGIIQPPTVASPFVT